MERETKIIIVGSHQLEVVTYLTGRELRIIQNVMLENLEMKQKSGETEMTGFKGSMLANQQDQQIIYIVKKFDEKTEGIIDLVLDLPSNEYSIVMDYIASIASPKAQASN